MKDATLWSIVILAILLSGCSEVRHARANEIRAETHRRNQLHAIHVAKAKALATTQVATAETLLWSGAISGAALLLVLAGAGSYYVIGFSIAKVRQANIMFVPLDEATRQYPLIIYRGNRAYLPNTGERVLLNKNHPPRRQLVAGAHAVQLGGVIAQTGQAPGEALTNIKLIEGGR